MCPGRKRTRRRRTRRGRTRRRKSPSLQDVMWCFLDPHAIFPGEISLPYPAPNEFFLILFLFLFLLFLLVFLIFLLILFLLQMIYEAGGKAPRECQEGGLAIIASFLFFQGTLHKWQGTLDKGQETLDEGHGTLNKGHWALDKAQWMLDTGQGTITIGNLSINCYVVTCVSFLFRIVADMAMGYWTLVFLRNSVCIVTMVKYQVSWSYDLASAVGKVDIVNIVNETDD